MPRAIALASEIAANPEPTLRVIKKMMLDDMLATDFAKVEQRSSDNFAASRQTAEHREALLALRERRPPRYHDTAYMDEVRAGLPKGTPA